MGASMLQLVKEWYKSLHVTLRKNGSGFGVQNQLIQLRFNLQQIFNGDSYNILGSSKQKYNEARWIEFHYIWQSKRILKNSFTNIFVFEKYIIIIIIMFVKG